MRILKSLYPFLQRIRRKKRGGFGGFIRDILILDGLFEDAHSRQHDSSMLNQTSINISVYPTVTDPFGRTCMPFNSVQDISTQQECAMCLAEGGKKAMSVYCGFCIILSHPETDRHPSRYSYCMGGNYQLFQRHVANCFVNKMKDDNTLT